MHNSTCYDCAKMCQACLWVSNIELVEEWMKRQQGNAKLTSNLVKESYRVCKQCKQQKHRNRRGIKCTCKIMS